MSVHNDVPTEIFELLLQSLIEKEVSKEVVDRLREVLINKEAINEKSLKAAIFGEETLL